MERLRTRKTRSKCPFDGLRVRKCVVLHDGRLTNLRGAPRAQLNFRGIRGPVWSVLWESSPSIRLCKQFRRLSQMYKPIVSLKVCSRSLNVLESCIVTNQLCDDRTKLGGFNRFWHKHVIPRLQCARSIFDSRRIGSFMVNDAPCPSPSLCASIVPPCISPR